MTALEKIEKHFNMSFNSIIKVLHWDKQISILQLSKKCGISRDVFHRECKKREIKLRSVSESRILFAQRGDEHWAYGLRKESSKWAKAASLRMKKHNPSNNVLIREKMSLTMSEIFKNNPYPQEIKTIKILNLLKIKYEFQKPIGTYIVDFFIFKNSICLEIDSTSKWGKERKYRAKVKDDFLKSLNFNVIRINKNHITLNLIANILKANNVI